MTGMHILITGHTGFKGSWLTLWLAEMGHSVSGISNDTPGSSKSSQIEISDFLTNDIRLDIRDSELLTSAISKARPDLIIHLAAQPLVRESYRHPRATFETNFNGTLNVIEAANTLDSLLGLAIITTDKVYKNVGKKSGYVETDPLGGKDPYSSSKAAADLLAQSMGSSFSLHPMAILRGGNVIGGGDISQERLIPDINRAWKSGKPIKLRYPQAIRPWQHVLDCLGGYILATKYLLDSKTDLVWNIGPDPEAFLSVEKLVESYLEDLGASITVEVLSEVNMHEEEFLTLDSTTASKTMGWKNQLAALEAIQWTSEWHKDVSRGSEPTLKSLEQIKNFRNLATIDFDF